jgi:hypothetical protein
MNRVCRVCSTNGEKGTSYRNLVRKPEGESAISRPRFMWKDNINTNLRNIRLGGMDWIDLAQDRDQWRAIVNIVMNLRYPVKY